MIKNQEEEVQQVKQRNLSLEKLPCLSTLLLLDSSSNLVNLPSLLTPEAFQLRWSPTKMQEALD